jgi:hypothetical protein
MLRAFLLAIGVTLLVLGIECVLLDHIHLRPPAPESSAISPSSTVGPPVTPPGWSGSLLLLAGSLVVLGSWRVSPGKRASQPAPPEEDEEATDSLAALIAARRIPDHSGDGDAGSFFDFDEDDFFDDEESPEID